MPRRILIACWGSYGDVYPYVGFARALKDRGHQPIVAAPAYYRPVVEQEAIDFAPVGPDIDPDDREMTARVMHPVKGTEAVIDIVVAALQPTYEEMRRAVNGVDLIVSHPLTFTAPMLAQLRGLPWVSTLLAPLGFFSVTDFPVLPPAPWVVHLRGLGPWFGRILVALARRATRDWMEPVYRLRAELGLPRGGHPLFDGQSSPLMTLALFSKVLAAPQPDWPPHTRTTGFVFYNGPAALDPALASFLDDGSPPVVFTLGSSAVGAAGRFYHESVNAVTRLGVRAVLLTGGFAENLPATLPPGVLLIDRAPHQLLFPRASAIVHQGGIGTTAQALRSGHPMLIVPHAHDQPDNAFRVTNLGVGRTLFPRRYKAERVASELERLLSDERYRERSETVAAQVNEERGADGAAEAIEELWCS
jgi:UDP:flavonoid glycosyltransferase YjiC (YdhE family)